MTVLLVIIYLAFIGLGLPDALLGSAWPVMQAELGAQLGLAGVVSMIVCGGTVVASLFSNRAIQRFGTGVVAVISVGLTAAALLGISSASSVWMLFLMAVPLGLGAGSVDAALNNFVSLHYKAMHMSWLHCFWGLGATGGPMIMAAFIGVTGGWKTGYLVIGLIQTALVLLLVVSLPRWKRAGNPGGEAQGQEEVSTLTNRQVLSLPNIKLALVGFVLYCGIELMAGLWSSSFFVEVKGFTVTEAARCASFFYGSITVGRFASGLLTLRLSSRQLIRMGQLSCVAGAMLMLLPLPIPQAAIAGIILVGLGAAPIYPCMLHETPNRFGKQYSQSVMGLQMAFAYVGSTLLPPLLGGLATTIGIWILPYGLLLGAGGMLVASELLQKRIGSKDKTFPA